MKLNNNHKKYPYHTKNTMYDNDEIKPFGRKGGKVIRERKEARQIDSEIRNYYTYR